MNILLAPLITTGSLSNQDLVLRKAYSVFDELVTSGNRIAELSELQQLDQLLSAVSQDDHRPMSGDKVGIDPPPNCAEASGMHTTALKPVDPALAQGELAEPLPGVVFAGEGFGGIFSSDQIRDLADAINMDHTEWMLQATRSPDL